MSLSVEKKSCFLGAHFSIAKGLHNALYRAQALDCNALQIFTKNSNAWKEKIVSGKEIELFEEAILKTGIKEIASHTSYLINLAASDMKKHARSCDALQKEIERSSALNIPYVVLHPGSHMGEGEGRGIDQISESINKIFNKTPGADTRLLLETTAGQGTSLGHKFEQISEIIEKIEDKNRVGVCVDSCHIFAAGYDIRTDESYGRTINDLDSVIGLENIFLFHLNDSKKCLGTRVDRHDHIGQGEIGIRAFELIMNDERFLKVPKIMETPKGEDGDELDLLNLKKLKSFLG
mgnify:CR=1 FL=1